MGIKLTLYTAGEKKDRENSKFPIKTLYAVRERAECGLTLGADRQLLICHLPVLLLIHTLTAEKRLDYKPDERIMHTKETTVVDFFGTTNKCHKTIASVHGP